MAFILEALLFSMALAHRINILSEEKSKLDKKLIYFQKEEQERLKTLVNQKTKDLTFALEEKNILYQELNHRVKNNLQMILSLIRLQISKTKSTDTKNELNITKNRINSISHLYEILYLQDNTSQIKTLKYFENIIENIRQNFNKEIQIVYKIEYNLDRDNLVYNGLILNELVTNSFKYAFKNKGQIEISLYKKEKIIYMIIQDDGVGFEQSYNNSLGLIIVKTLVQKQLYGKIEIDSSSGTKTTISWKDDR